jgi:hypothetical protein
MIARVRFGPSTIAAAHTEVSSCTVAPASAEGITG